MSKRSDLLVACMLGNRWSSSSTPSQAATCVASSPLAGVNSRVHLESLWYSIRNGGGNYTVQVQVRGQNATVLQTVEHILAGTSSANVAMTKMGFANPKKGTSLNVFMNTLLASVVQAVNIAGWIEDTNG